MSQSARGEDFPQFFVLVLVLVIGPFSGSSNNSEFLAIAIAIGIPQLDATRLLGVGRNVQIVVNSSDPRSR